MTNRLYSNPRCARTARVNEFDVNNGGCEEMRNNTTGSFYCGCGMGYQLDSSGLNCSGMLTTQLCSLGFLLATL